MSAPSIANRIRELDWSQLADNLHEYGYALTPPVFNTQVLRADECEKLIRLFDEDKHYRSTIDMSRVRFGSGVYRYFKRPLPELVSQLRDHFYPPLATIANTWAKRLGNETRYPSTLKEFLGLCHREGQNEATPLIFSYEVGDYNAFHQDLYGKIAFPFQVVTILSKDEDYMGGEFMLYKLRPRQQSVGQVVVPKRGQMLIFPSRYKPELKSKGGYYRAELRHGVSRLHSGKRHSLGIIFHDAEK